jgi:hypothetical protein
MHTTLWRNNTNGRGHLEDLRVDLIITLNVSLITVGWGEKELEE